MDDMKGYQKISQAINFLEKVASNERKNEEFLLKTRFGDKFKDIFNSGNIDDWENYIISLNSQIQGKENFQKNIKEERARIEKYLERYKKAEAKLATLNKNLTEEEKKKQKFIIYNDAELFNQDLKTRSQKIQAKDINSAFKGVLNNRTKMQNIIGMIINKYGKEIFTINNTSIEAKPEKVIPIIIETLSNLLMKAYEKIGDKKTNANEVYNIIKKMLEDDAQEELEIKAFIQELSANQALTDAIYTSYTVSKQQLQSYQESKKNINKAVKKIQDSLGKEKFNKNLLNKSPDLSQQIRDLVRQSSLLKVSGYYTSEKNTLIDLVKAFGGRAFALGEGVNQATDTIGVLTYSIEENFDIDDQVENIYNLESEKILKEAYSKTSNKKSKVENMAIIEKALQQQKKMAEQMKAELGNDNDLALFNFHTTVKDYKTIGGASSSYHGPSLGANLAAQLNTISTLSNKALGDNSIDQGSLTLAIMNCAPGLMGYSQKGALESYLSSFVGMLMFDDAAFWVGENIEAETSIVKQIHLYSLNGMYVPQSYVLTNLAIELRQNLETAFSTAHSAGFMKATVKNDYKIKNFKDQQLTKEMWQAEAAEAEASSSIVINFMGNFVSLIQSITSKLG